MIVALKGHVIGFASSRVYIEVSNITYEIYIALNTLSKLQNKKKKEELVELSIYHQFTANLQKLYGFLDTNEKEFFVAIQNMKGCGPTLTLSLLSHLSPVELLGICRRLDAQILSKIPKIGKRTAEQVIFEVNRNIDKLENLTEGTQELQRENLDPRAIKAKRERELAEQGLLQLGYSMKEIYQAIKKTSSEKSSSVDKDKLYLASEWISKCLRIL